MTQYRSDAHREALMDTLNTERGANADIVCKTGAPSGSTSGSEVATISGNATKWGTSANGVLTSDATTLDSSATGGTVAHYELLTSGATWLESGAVDGSDGVTIDNAVIVATQTVQLDGDWVNTAAYDDGI